MRFPRGKEKLPGFLVFGCVLAAVPCYGFQERPGEESRCANCHSCEAPTHEDPCLLECTRPAWASAPTDGATETPDFFVLGELSDIYVPVIFPHRIHAEMEGMGEGCNVCHHHNPPGSILKCRECHESKPDIERLDRPSLKGAYHRQCLGCHREWSHETDCAVCHAKRIPGQVYTPPPDSTDIMGTLHPNIAEPDTWVYRIEDMEEGPIVTFHHKEHVRLFGLKCVECHKRESCGRCHDAAAKTPHVREDPHEDCMACHDVESDCERCHAQEESKGFDHGNRSGFVLRAYHKSLACSECHLGGRNFGGLDRDCLSCHAEDFTPDAFDHSVTGLRLDENHVEFECDACHEGGFEEPTSCGLCHDDDRKYPNSTPGIAVRLSRGDRSDRFGPSLGEWLAGLSLESTED